MRSLSLFYDHPFSRYANFLLSTSGGLNFCHCDFSCVPIRLSPLSLGPHDEGHFSRRHSKLSKFPIPLIEKFVYPYVFGELFFLLQAGYQQRSGFGQTGGALIDAGALQVTWCKAYCGLIVSEASKTSFEQPNFVSPGDLSKSCNIHDLHRHFLMKPTSVN